jgi:uncharacterized protein
VAWGGRAGGGRGRGRGVGAGAGRGAGATPRTLAVVVGIMVLVAVVVTAWAVRVRITPLTLVVAGATSGMAGTATSIGGPPLAVLYQHSAGPTVRATLGGFFFLGTLLSLASLTLGGQFTAEQGAAGLALIPFVLGGYLASIPLRRRYAMAGIRTPLLVVVSVSALALIVQALL